MQKIQTIIIALLISSDTFAQAPNWAWAKRRTDSEGNTCIVTDMNGNIYVVGYLYSPSIKFDTTTVKE